jgi:hypothetical protein
LWETIDRAAARHAETVNWSCSLLVRRLTAPWRVEENCGRYVVRDANGQSLAYVYGADSKVDADNIKTLTRRSAPRPQHRQAASAAA